MEYFGIFSFVMVLVLMGRVHRLERVLRENGIGSVRAAGLGDQLRRQVGQTVELTLETSDGDIMGKTCRILDTDETWALVLANEGKKNECEKLIRLDSVKQIKVK
ncbi:MAG: hypothetical protein HDT33_04305 [Clostridiales bacterium]|nr:hypothetical protein [Clostridiales bacterium]